MTSYTKRTRELERLEERRLARLTDAGERQRADTSAPVAEAVRSLVRCAVCGRPLDSLSDALLVQSRRDPHESFLCHRPSSDSRCFNAGVGPREYWTIALASSEARVRP